MTIETDKIYREANTRHHRTLAHYFALYAWSKKLDCLIVAGSQIKNFLGLKQIKKVRIEWFEEDIRPWFPEMRTMWNSAALHSIILSRVPLPGSAMAGKLNNDSRASRLTMEGVPAAIFLDGDPISHLPKEDEIVASMGLIATGLRALGTMPGLAKPKTSK